MIEADVEGRLVRRVAKLGGKAIKLESPGTRGFPDRLVIDQGGRLVFVETKAPSGRLSAQQRFWIGALRRFGFDVAVPKTVEEVDALVEDFFAAEKRKRRGDFLPRGFARKEKDQ